MLGLTFSWVFAVLAIILLYVGLFVALTQLVEKTKLDMLLKAVLHFFAAAIVVASCICTLFGAGLLTP